MTRRLHRAGDSVTAKDDTAGAARQAVQVWIEDDASSGLGSTTQP